MRRKRQGQLELAHTIPRTEIGRELAAMSKVLDEMPKLYEVAYQDLIGLKDAETGRIGMTAEQVVRAAILKQYRSLSYEELAFHLDDSASFRAFARLSRGQHPSASTLQDNIKALSETTWEDIQRIIVQYAAAKGIEKGRTIRVDSTATETDIHYPTDSRLLQDLIGAITRLLMEGRQLRPVPGYSYSDHRRVVKKRALKILNSKDPSERKQCYRDLLGIATQVKGYAVAAIARLWVYQNAEMEQVVCARVLAQELERLVGLLDSVEDQTKRRVLNGEKVPAGDKVVSIFECHTDIIEKGNRETVYGHKLFVAGGQSGLVLDCVIQRGNPADSNLFVPLLERQEKLFQRVPRQVAADGGFASVDNLRQAKKRGVTDVSFSKRKGLSVLEMVKSTWVYKKLRNFRAGIEAGISTLKRAFGLTRCTWSGWDGFCQYVRSAIASYNVMLLARLLILAR
jgi:transposase, IS5 family